MIFTLTIYEVIFPSFSHQFFHSHCFSRKNRSTFSCMPFEATMWVMFKMSKAIFQETGANLTKPRGGSENQSYRRYSFERHSWEFCHKILVSKATTVLFDWFYGCSDQNSWNQVIKLSIAKRRNIWYEYFIFNNSLSIEKVLGKVKKRQSTWLQSILQSLVAINFTTLIGCFYLLTFHKN